MNHKVLAPSRRLANELADIIDAEGWHARVITRNRRSGVIVYAPYRVLVAACRRAGLS